MVFPVCCGRPWLVCKDLPQPQPFRFKPHDPLLNLFTTIFASKRLHISRAAHTLCIQCLVQRWNNHLTFLWSFNSHLAFQWASMLTQLNEIYTTPGAFQTPQLVLAVTHSDTRLNKKEFNDFKLHWKWPASRSGCLVSSAASSIMADNYDRWGRSSGKWRPKNI